MEHRLHVVHRERYNEQHFHAVQNPGPLGISSIRIRTVLVGLSANNLSYCLAGTILHWWDCFPTPSYVQNASQYGVPPAWGYAIVEDSNIPSITAGRIIYGMLPLSTHLVDLQLRQSEQISSHYIETSPHRGKLMTMYQRYQLEPTDIDLSSQLVLWNSVIKTWESGKCLSDECFAPDGKSPIHPFGVPVSSWTRKEANLEDACVICLAAGTKTSRSFLYARAVSSQANSYTVLEVTTDPEGCRRFLKNPPFKHQVVHYDDIETSISSFRKYVILDFGGRNFALEKAAKAAKEANPDAEMICISVGGESKVYDAESTQKRRQVAADVGAVQMNATGIRDAAMTRDGEARYFDALEKSFEGMVDEQLKAMDGKVLGVSLNEYKGLRGVEGVEGLWQKLCSGQLGGDHGIVVRVG